MFEAERSFVRIAAENLPVARDYAAAGRVELARGTLSPVMDAADKATAKAVLFCLTHSDHALKYNEAETACRHLTTAMRLSQQFADGLAEIDHSAAVDIYKASVSPTTPIVEPTETVIEEAPSLEEDVSITFEDGMDLAFGEAAFDDEPAAAESGFEQITKASAQTLSELTPLATETEAPAIEKLIELSGHAPADKRIPQISAQPEHMDDPDAPLEMMMSALSNYVLGHAWRHNIRVSFSYACADAAVKQSAIRPLTDALSALMAYRIANMETRQSVLHINLTATSSGQNLSFQIDDGLVTDLDMLRTHLSVNGVPGYDIAIDAINSGVELKLTPAKEIETPLETGADLTHEVLA